MKQINLLTIGDACIDLHMTVEGTGVSQDHNQDQPRLCFFHGSKIPVKTLTSTVAGNAVNVAAGAKKLGLEVAIYSEFGDDEYAQRIERELEEKGIITDFIHKTEGRVTGIHPIIMYAKERTIFTHHEVKDYKIQNWGNPDWIYYTSVGPGFEEFQQELCNYLKQNPLIGVAFNPGTQHMNAGVERLKNILEVVHVLFVNKEEAEILTGIEGELEELHTNLQLLGPKLTIITDGENGASGFDGNNMTRVPAQLPFSQVKDKTGAGDSFASGTIAALFYKKSLKEALIWGTINSASVLTEIGAVNGLKTKEEMEKEASTILPSL